MEILLAIVTLILECIVFYFIISSAVKSGNRELVITIKESTSKILEELRKAREGDESK